MLDLTPGKMRGIDELATDGGVICVLAIDHRDSFRAMVGDGVSDEEISQFKICLLYTSPSPRDQRGSRMPSSA